MERKRRGKKRSREREKEIVKGSGLVGSLLANGVV
jgi:hypothetical protein